MTQLSNWTDNPQVQSLLQIVRAASQAILTIYQDPRLWDASQKADSSPLTAADLASHRLLVDQLPQVLDVPVLSEESTPEELAMRRSWNCYWLVDPLDGTKEFLARNGEFAINIALVVGQEAVLGLIHQPTTNKTYLGCCAANPLGLAKGAGIWMEETVQPLKPRSMSDVLASGQMKVLTSHRHGQLQAQQLADSLSQTQSLQLETLSLGSALKFGYLAEGRADFYPRLAPTCEWDTAAGQALLRSVGGDLVAWPSFESLSYNQKSDLLNPYFLAFADAGFNWQRYCSDF